MTQPILDVRSLSTGYGALRVVHDVDLTVHEGEVVALLGANGAGKTTTLLAISGLLPVLDGDIHVLGTPVPSSRRASTRTWRLARRGIAHVPEDRALFFDLTARENLRLGLRSRRDDAAIARALEPFPALRRILDRRAGLLSGGEQQMLAIARALAGRPRLLMVDELSLGLAPIIVEELLPALRAIAVEHGTAVLLVEQHVAASLDVADRAYVLRRGRVVLSGRATELAGHHELLEASYLGDTAMVADLGDGDRRH